ncbi:sugar-binding domain-containing protein [Cohaesibacter celericrescens]|uniref:DNA-binding transcriptional regulator n=1 Tax=Cohaesibacter celericrescens TaxID=2067669 RepID=A0A2N5XLC4_9HYPH|nr:sugar-binding domain-containing protein [Cohaesibacter celericrescens]PLW75336.1 DNA-binding transcriptional regulator [Cohaesibacter celericrescens]
MSDDFTVEHQDAELLSRVAWYYYHDGMTQSEIGAALNLSRIKISRMLEKGRKMGLIHIHINSNYGGCFALESRLQELFGLREVRVIPGDESENSTVRIAEAASQYLMGKLKTADLLAVGWGATVMGALQRLAQTLSHRDISLVSLTGGVAAYIEGVASGRSAQNVHLIPAPLLVSNPDLAHSLRTERHVVDVMNMAKTANYALVGIGAVANQATLVTSGYATGSQFEAFRRQGAVGDIIAVFFDKDGNVLDLPFHDTLVGLDLEALRNIPNVVAAACGQNKVEAIRAGAKGKHFNVLITDEPTALAMIEGEA